jgi:guanylate cyclase soluble subunit beta
VRNLHVTIVFSLALEENKQKLAEIDKKLEAEREKLDLMLLDNLPLQISKALDAGNAVMPRKFVVHLSYNLIPGEFDEATVLYADVPSFYSVLESYEPEVAIAALDELFTRFDRLVHLHNVSPRSYITTYQIFRSLK